MPPKKYFFQSFLDYFLKVPHSLKLKSHKKVTKQWKKGFSYYFALMKGFGSVQIVTDRIQEVQKNKDPQQCFVGRRL
jgi:hypothetical protein